MNPKKILLLIVLFLAFIKGVHYLNERANTELYDDYYTSDAKQEGEPEPWWQRIVTYFEDLFDDKSEKFIEK